MTVLRILAGLGVEFAAISLVWLLVWAVVWRPRRREARTRDGRYRLPTGQRGRRGWPAVERLTRRERSDLAAPGLRVDIERWRAELFDDPGVVETMTQWERSR